MQPLCLRPTPRPPWRTAALALAAALAGCGGGVYIDGGDPPYGPPAISIAASPDVAAPGELIRLVAAVTADNGIDYVTFYRIDFGTSTPLATLYTPPAQVDTRIPANAGRTVSYFARVCDLARYCTDSRTVTVAVVP
jgi:hypothetical protein